MKPVIIFAGTTEGRELSEYLAARHVPVTACVATEYGETLLSDQAGLHVHTGRMDEAGMEHFFGEEDPELVVDATHPYAVEASKNIAAACTAAGVEYLRLLRESSEEAAADSVCVPSVEAAVDYLMKTQGNILVTTGSKELWKYTRLPDYEKRVFARVLSTGEVAEACEKLGFRGRSLICMQGPFSEELNAAMLRQFDCRYLVTKEAGHAGGYEEKLRAAARTGAVVVRIQRPAEQSGRSFEEVLAFLRERFGLSAAEEPSERVKRLVTLIGIGMGSRAGMTGEAIEAIDEADLLIGARRMLEAAGAGGKPTLCEYDAERIADYLRLHPEYRRAVVLLSGDIGFYSGARKLYDALAGGGYEIRSLCGISSVVYFCGKLHMAWEDVCLKSAHGRRTNLVGAVKTHRKTFALIGSAEGVGELCRELLRYGLADVTVHVGERLGYGDERITSGKPEQLLGKKYDSLSVVLIENPSASSTVRACIPDGEFLRGEVPMTKSEIRSLSVAKLGLPKDAVVYDVGAGTGSVSVELALAAVDGTVYAIERNEEACALIEANRTRFGTPNIELVRGSAPEVLEALPAPTHAFIGGSAGQLREILALLLAKNPAVRIVINTVTVETLGEVTACLKELPLIEEEILSVSAARARRAGPYHLMTGQNPVYIVTCRGGES